MVGYANVLNATQVDDVATFVSRYAGTRQTCEECTAGTTTGS
jgi:hypothetical protein